MKNEEKQDNDKKVEKKDPDELLMDIRLFQLKSSDYWLAIKRYINVVANNAREITSSTDPFKNPSDICKNQGIGYGLLMLGKYVDELEDPEAKKSKEE